MLGRVQPKYSENMFSLGSSKNCQGITTHRHRLGLLNWLTLCLNKAWNDDTLGCMQ